MSKPKRSIKRRVTSYYAVVLLLFIVLIIGAFYLLLDLQFSTISRGKLERTVRNAFDSITTPGEWVEIDSDFDFYVDEVTLIIYGPEGTKILGNEPSGFPSSIPLRDDAHQEFDRGEVHWRIYDLSLTYQNDATIWVRGVTSVSDSLSALQGTLRIMLITLPLLALMAIVAGYLVTRQAFQPVNQIQHAADKIIQEKDLSSRIAIEGERHDELGKLVSTYNEMLDEIEDAFNNEQRFTSDVSHELRTPIAVIISQAEYGLSEDDPAARQESLEAILAQAQHMSAMVSQLLEISRNQQSLHELETEPINLTELCEIVAEELAERASEKGISFMSRLDPDAIVDADQTQLLRAVINLVNNAITYGKEDGFIMLETQKTETEVLLRVTDDGIGIAPEHLDNIFKPFYQADPARTRSKSNNTGLGLTMVRQIIEAHGGTIEVQSTLGSGSSFIVHFPKPQDETVET